jgi:hypothetical protein
MTQQNELLEAALKLAEIARRNTDDGDEWEAAITAVEAFKPKHEPLEKWAVKFEAGGCEYFGDESKATKRASSSKLKMTVHHLREVTPIEWQKWVAYHGSNEIHTADRRMFGGDIHIIVDKHNAEMQRVTGTEGK